VIDTKVYAILWNIMAPAKPATKEYDAIIKALQVHLDPKPIDIVEQFKLH